MGYRWLVGPAELVDFVGFGLLFELMTPVDFAASAVVDHVVIEGGVKVGVGHETGSQRVKLGVGREAGCQVE